MNIIVFDTETIGVEKTFCYDIGYVVVNVESKTIITKKEFIIEQVWSNKPLFETAYYADKKTLYVSKMRGRKAKLVNWGTAIGAMIKDIKQYEVESAYAYNADFDTRVFDFNADWYKTRNPLDYVKVFDIWGYTSEAIINGLVEDYVAFANKNALTSECGNIKNNADSWGKFFYGMEWDEEHTALEDSLVECGILLEMLERGLEIDKDYKVAKQIKSEDAPMRCLEVIEPTGEIYSFNFKSKTEYKKNGWRIVLRD